MKLLKNLKHALIEEIPRENNSRTTEITYREEPEIVEVAFEEVNDTNLIEVIYRQNDLDDRSKSIFKIDELLSTLPDEMADETKRTTILMILGSFGLNTPHLIDDGETRLQVLEGVRTRIITEGTKKVSTMQSDIEEYKRHIALMEKEISDHKRELSDAEDTIGMETAAIKQLITFMEEV